MKFPRVAIKYNDKFDLEKPSLRHDIHLRSKCRARRPRDPDSIQKTKSFASQFAQEARALKPHCRKTMTGTILARYVKGILRHTQK
jgi:hypothetical protein